MWLTTHMMTGSQSQVTAVRAYASTGRTGMIHYTVKSSQYWTWPNLLDNQKVASQQLTLLCKLYPTGLKQKNAVQKQLKMKDLLYPCAKADLRRLTMRQAKERNSYTFKNTLTCIPWGMLSYISNILQYIQYMSCFFGLFPLKIVSKLLYLLSFLIWIWCILCSYTSKVM